MVALLKQKSKVIKEHKPRKTYAAAEVFPNPMADQIPMATRHTAPKKPENQQVQVD